MTVSVKEIDSKKLRKLKVLRRPGLDPESYKQTESYYG